MTDTSHDLVIIGAGVAGLHAARSALRAGRSVAYLEGSMFGGLVLNVNELDGAVAGSGSEYASTVMSDVADLGGEYVEAIAAGIETDGDTLVVTSDAGRHRAGAVIVASGAALKKLGVPGEAELEHKGVSHCADCDGPLYQGDAVVVVGGGDSALQSALVLARFASRVHLVHRGSAFRAAPHFVDAIGKAANVEIHWNSRAYEVLGSDGVEGVRVGDKVIACKGFFALVGLAPATAFLPAAIRRDANGAVLAGPDRATSLPGVFAAGAVRAGCGGMLADAVADGEAAAEAAGAWLAARRAAHAA